MNRPGARLTWEEEHLLGPVMGSRRIILLLMIPSVGTMGSRTINSLVMVTTRKKYKTEYVEFKIHTMLLIGTSMLEYLYMMTLYIIDSLNLYIIIKHNIMLNLINQLA